MIWMGKVTKLKIETRKPRKLPKYVRMLMKRLARLATFPPTPSQKFVNHGKREPMVAHIAEKAAARALQIKSPMLAIAAYRGARKPSTGRVGIFASTNIGVSTPSIRPFVVLDRK